MKKRNSKQHMKKTTSFLSHRRAILITTMAIATAFPHLAASDHRDGVAKGGKQFISLLGNEKGTDKDSAVDVVESYRITGAQGVPISTEVTGKGDAGGDDGYIINFNNLNIMEVIRFISKISKVNFIFEEGDLDFNVTIVSEGPTSIENVMAALLQILRIHDFSLLQQDNTIVIHKNKSVVNPPTLLVHGGDSKSIVTESFRVNYLDTTRLASLLKPYLSQEAIINTSPETGHILITDINTNIEKIGELLAVLDVPNRSLDLASYRVRNIGADVLIDLAKKILDPLSEGGTLSLISQPVSSTIFIVSSPYLIQRALSVLKTLDRGEPLMQSDGVRAIRVDAEDPLSPAWPYSEQAEIQQKKQTAIDSLEDRIRYARIEKEEGAFRGQEAGERVERENIYKDLEEALGKSRDYTLKDDEDATRQAVEALQSVRKRIADLDERIGARIEKEMVSMEAVVAADKSDNMYENLKKFEALREELKREEARIQDSGKKLIDLIRSLESDLIRARERQRRYESDMKVQKETAVKQRAVIQDVVTTLQKPEIEKSTADDLLGRLAVLKEDKGSLPSKGAEDREKLLESVVDALKEDRKKRDQELLEEKRSREDANERYLQKMSQQLLDVLAQDRSDRENALKEQMAEVKKSLALIDAEAIKRDKRVMEEKSVKEATVVELEKLLQSEYDTKNAVELRRDKERGDFINFLEILRKEMEENKDQINDLSTLVKTIVSGSHNGGDATVIAEALDSIKTFLATHSNVDSGVDNGVVLADIEKQAMVLAEKLSEEQRALRASLVEKLAENRGAMSEKERRALMGEIASLVKKFQKTKKPLSGTITKEQENLASQIMQFLQKDDHVVYDTDLITSIIEELKREDLAREGLIKHFNEGIANGTYDARYKDGIERYLLLLEEEMRESKRLQDNINLINSGENRTAMDGLKEIEVDLKKYFDTASRQYDELARYIALIGDALKKYDYKTIAERQKYRNDLVKGLNMQSIEERENELLFIRLYKALEEESRVLKNLAISEDDLRQSLSKIVGEEFHDLATKIASGVSDETSDTLLKALENFLENDEKRQQVIESYLVRRDAFDKEIEKRFDKKYAEIGTAEKEAHLQSIEHQIAGLREDIDKMSVPSDEKEQNLQKTLMIIEQDLSDLKDALKNAQGDDQSHYQEFLSTLKERLAVIDARWEGIKEDDLTQYQERFGDFEKQLSDLESTLVKGIAENAKPQNQELLAAIEKKFADLENLVITRAKQSDKVQYQEQFSILEKQLLDVNTSLEGIDAKNQGQYEELLNALEKNLADLESSVVSTKAGGQAHYQGELKALERQLSDLESTLVKGLAENAKPQNQELLSTFAEKLEDVNNTLEKAKTTDKARYQELLKTLESKLADVESSAGVTKESDHAQYQEQFARLENQLVLLQNTVEEAKESDKPPYQELLILEKKFSDVEDAVEGLKKSSQGYPQEPFETLGKQLTALENSLKETKKSDNPRYQQLFQTFERTLVEVENTLEGVKEREQAEYQELLKEFKEATERHELQAREAAKQTTDALKDLEQQREQASEEERKIIEGQILKIRSDLKEQEAQAVMTAKERNNLVEEFEKQLVQAKKTSEEPIERPEQKELIQRLQRLEESMASQDAHDIVIAKGESESLEKGQQERADLIAKIEKILEEKSVADTEASYALEKRVRETRRAEEERAEIERKIKEREERVMSDNNNTLSQRLQRMKLDRKSQLDMFPTLSLPDLNTAGAPVDKTDFFIYKLEHQDGSEIATSLRAVADGIVGESAIPGLKKSLENVRHLSASNSILITGTRDILRKLRVLISTMDIPVKQVFVEMLVVETTIADSLTFGVEWGTQMKRDGVALNSVGGFLEDKSALGNSIQSLTSSGALSASDVPVTGGFSFGVIGRLLTHNEEIFTSIGALVKALSTDSNTEIILNPQIVAEEGKTAEIFVGDTIRYRTSSITQTGGNVESSFTTGNFGTSFKVTPRLGNRVDTITLEIEQDVSDVTAIVEEGPQTQTSTTKTRVHIPDRNFLILSGMIKEKDKVTKRKVPLLGSLPIIGTLFKSETHTKDKRNIMIFIRPHILKNEEDIRSLTQSRRELYNEGAKFNDYTYDKESMYDILEILEGENK